MKSSTEKINEIIDFLQDWIISTERIVGAGLKRNKVKFSDNTRKNIRIQIVQTLNELSLEFYFRDALRFVDMPAGNGYHKGQKIGRTSINNIGRKRKKIINKPIYARLQRLQSGIALKIIEDFSKELHSIN